MAVKRKSVEPAAPLPPSAADMLIASARKGQRAQCEDPGADALGELRKICAYNDGAAWKYRVTVEKAIEMLQSHGWSGRSREALNHLCRRRFGRSSYAQA